MGDSGDFLEDTHWVSHSVILIFDLPAMPIPSNMISSHKDLHYYISRSSWHTGNCVLWTLGNFLRFGVWLIFWVGKKSISGFFPSATARSHFHSDTMVLGSFVCSLFCNSLVCQHRSFHLIQGKWLWYLFCFATWEWPLSFLTLWKNHSCGGKHEALYRFRFLMREKYQFGCQREVHSTHLKSW